MTDTSTSETDTIRPSYVLKLLRKHGSRYGTKVGVTFATERGNQRVVWDVLPSSLELAHGTLIVVPYEDANAAFGSDASDR